MQGASREALKASLASFEDKVGSLPDGAGSGEVSDGLFAVAGLLDREPSLRRALSDPASTPGSRRQLVQNLLGSQLAPLPLQVLQDVVEQPWSSPVDLRDGVEKVAATAALRAAEGSGELDDVEDELFRFARLLEREPALRAALTDPGLPAERKSAILTDLLGGKAKETTVQLVDVSVNRRRGRSLEDLLEELSTLAAQRRERYVAHVRVALPLDATQTSRLQSSLARIYGREVQLQVDVDPTVVGGVQVRVGRGPDTEVLDGTVTRKLEAARRGLAR
ncbi:MAG TPA: F0F1 ATP synthase subunit delta [Mycobacteriales bacterium]|nr:F0F1 ATP synthase subunit delta [Mycobacteriales bacterium]